VNSLGIEIYTPSFFSSDNYTYNTYTSNGSSVNASSINCSSTDKFSGYNNVTGVFTCSADMGGAGSTDGNNYTTAISFSGGSTKTLNLARFGMGNLTATFEDNEGSDTNNYPTSLAITNGSTHTITISRNGLSDLVATFFDLDNDTIVNETTIDIYTSNNGYSSISTIQNYFNNGTNVNASSLSSNLSNYYLTSNPSGYITNTVNSSYALQTNLIAYNTNGTHINQTYADNKYALIGAGSDNTSWNETFARTIFKAIGIQTWNSTHADFNKTYADTLYLTQSTANGFYKALGVETWNSTFALFNKTYADTLYAPIGGGGDNTTWNETLARTLFKTIGIQTWNDTHATFNKTYGDTLYYSSSNPSGYITNTVNSSYYLTSNPSGYITNTVNNSYYLITNPNAYVNTTTATTLNNRLTINCANITGGSDGDYCTDTTGGGGLTVPYISNVSYTTNDSISNQANWTLVPNMTLLLQNNSRFNIECNLRTRTNATTTGFQTRINITSYTLVSNYLEYWTSATAKAVCTATANLTCSATAGQGNVEHIYQLKSFLITSTDNANYTLEIKSELAGAVGSVNLSKGSTCITTKV
jgi:hypothetical protein